MDFQSLTYIAWALLFVLLSVISAFACKYVTMRIILVSIFVYPFIFAALFFIFRHHTIVNSGNKTAFFERFKVGAHRGSHYGNIPENSLEAFAAAKMEGAQLVEMDLQTTSDGVAVICHDPNTLAVTGVDREISKMTLAEFKQLRFTLNNGSLPTFEEAVEWCVQNDMMMLWDIKDVTDNMTSTFSKLIQINNLYGKVIVSGFNPIDIYKVKSRDPNILTGFTYRSSELSTVDEDGVKPRFQGILHVIALMVDNVLTALVKSFAMPTFLGADMLLFHCNDVSRYGAMEARRNDMYMAAWTSNIREEMEFFLNYLHVPFLTDDARLAGRVARNLTP
ncbi:unnamed protein product [Caenorhabditis auriculariae]|uniref:GP-PDE domain-containing protein n=1 Tax=Caenorhabditis auriculariae TaxID=2777116 RepID=A0A8S1HQ03_9PELO|nr:unnamed protein product [Caenorhabditis auriculariae]